MPTRTLGVALWNYRDDDGRKRRALFGQRFELPEDEVARGERAGVFAPEAETTGVSTATDTPSAPKQAALKAAWLEYAVTIGMDRAETDAMSKADLIDAVTARLGDAT